MRRPISTAFWCLSILLGGFSGVGSTVAAPYALGVGDEIQLKVYDWRSAVGDVHEWTALNDKFGVGADGEIALPLIGAVPAAGRTPAQLADAIATRLKDTVGLANRPQASVEIIKYRPFYILGSVTHPGEYPYRPGMNVLQAVSIAGGLFRIGDPGLLLGQRGVVSTAGDLRVLQIDYAGLSARRARLKAELDGSAKIPFSRELLAQQQDPNVAQFLAQEQSMFLAYNDAVRSETDALTRLKDLLNGEITSLQSKIKTVDQELALLKQELQSTSSLVQRGLAAAPREFSLRQTELQTETRRLDLDTAVLRAREDIGKADQSLVELRNKKRHEALTELSDTESKLSQTAAKIKTSQALLAQDGSGADLASILGQDTGPPVYSIVRCAGDGLQTIAAAEDTAVQPGDTIDVKRRGVGAALPAIGVSDPVLSSQEN